jgi:integral membrane protein (TIGR00529 family)
MFVAGENMLPLILLFVLVLVLIRLKIPIGLALLAGAIFLGIWRFGFSGDFWALLYNSLINLRSWALVLTVVLILTFANFFESLGFVKSMVSSLESFLPPRWVARAAPAIIGLLPMPGGAMVSAPIVKHIARDSDIGAEKLTAQNYWWRHVWEATWPLYPSIILAAAVLKVSVWEVAIIIFPISLTCIVVGLLRGGVGSSSRVSGRTDFLRLLKSLWPILFIVIVGLVLKIDLIISVLIVLAILAYRFRPAKAVVYGALKNGFAPWVIILIFGVMTLMYAMESTGIAEEFYEELLRLSIPPGLVAFAVPFVVGLLTGVTSAYIGVGFPIVLPLLGTESLTYRAGMLLAFAGGFMGVMASPVHLCLVLTARYFGASLAGTIRQIAVPIILTSCISWILSILLYG